MKRGKPLKRTLLKRGKGINPISPGQKQINLEWKALGGYLAQHRAGWRCELPGCGGRYNLQGHHIIKRRFNIHNAGNCLVACGGCHRHDKWGPGIPIPVEQALLLVAGLNKKYNIDEEMTGADVLKGKEESDD